MIIDIAAWVGAAQILAMYALLSFNRIRTRKLYHFFNFTGASFVCYACVAGEVWQAATVEGIWAAMALFFLIRQCYPRNLTKEEKCLIQFEEANAALKKYEGKPVQEALEAIKKEFPDYKVYLLQEDSIITADFDYDRITFVNHKGLARVVTVG